jgi:NAD(P)-dependent dehydrogenase (short-subunit alcohol dehydrogenase family)
LINNAGILIKKRFTDLKQSDFDSIYHTNVFSPFKLTIALRKNLKNGHVVNVGSMGGYENTLKFPGMILYSSSKAAIHCLSQCLAVEFASDKITVNCISMGSVDTDMVRTAFPGFKPPIDAKSMAEFFCWFSKNGQKFFNGQIIPVALTTP